MKQSPEKSNKAGEGSGEQV